jgi:hypothetical protein
MAEVDVTKKIAAPQKRYGPYSPIRVHTRTD